jgi:hypothetical protein
MATSTTTFETNSSRFIIQKVMREVLIGGLTERYQITQIIDGVEKTPFIVQLMSITTSQKPTIQADEKVIPVPEEGPWLIDFQNGKVVCWGNTEAVDEKFNRIVVDVYGKYKLDAHFGYIALKD